MAPAISSAGADALAGSRRFPAARAAWSGSPRVASAQVVEGMPLKTAAAAAAQSASPIRCRSESGARALTTAR